MRNKTYIAALCLLALPAWGLGQSFLLQGPPVEGRGRITLRYLWPQADLYGNSGYDIFSGLYDLSAAYRLGERLHLVAALPYIRYRYSFVNWEQERISESNGGLGAISAALQYHLNDDEKRSTALTAGVYLPTFGGRGRDCWDCLDLSDVGLEADFSEFPKSLDATTPFVRITHYSTPKDGWRIGLEGGALMLLAPGSDYRPLYVQGGVSLGRSAGPVEVTAEWSGTVHLAGFVDEVYIHLYHQAGIGVSWGRGRLRPGIFYAMSLDRYSREDSRGVIGARLSFEL